MALLQRDQLLVNVSSRDGCACSHRGLLQQAGSSLRPQEKGSCPPVSSPTHTAVLNSLFYHLLAGRQLPYTVSAQQLNRAQVRGCHSWQVKGLVTSPSPDAEADGNSSRETRNSDLGYLVGCWLITTLSARACIFTVCSRTCSEVDPDAPCHCYVTPKAVVCTQGELYLTGAGQHGLSAGRVTAIHSPSHPFMSESCFQRTRLQLWPSPLQGAEKRGLRLRLCSLRPSLS